MLDIAKVFKSKSGKILLSVLWGLALAAIFKFTCEGRDCLVYKAPVVQEMTGNTYQHNNECYTFRTETVACEGDIVDHR